MLKKQISIMLIAVFVLSLLPVNVFAERVLPEKTNAYTECDSQRGMRWLSDNTLVSKIVSVANQSNKSDDTIYSIAKKSLIIRTGKAYGYINGFRQNFSDTKQTARFIDGKIYVPFRFVYLASNKNALYNEDSKLVCASDGNRGAKCTPVVEDNCVYVPVRELYETGLGKKVVYAGNGVVVVTSSETSALLTDAALTKLADPDFYIERDKMMHPFESIRFALHDSSLRDFATQGTSNVNSVMESFLKGAYLSQNYISDKNLEGKYPEGSRSLSNLTSMSYYDLADYADYTALNYTYKDSNGTEQKRTRHIGERAGYERYAAYLARLYELNPDEDMALRIIIMLYHTALRFDFLDTSYRTDNSFYNYAYVTPSYLVYAYDKVYHSPMWKSFGAAYGTDAKATVEKYFRTIYNYIYANTVGNPVSNYPLIMEHIAGIGIALDDSNIMRFVIERLNMSVNPHSFYADGMWYEGSADYGSQMVGHAYGAARIIKEYRDRRCYTDDIFGFNVKLDGTLDTANRWTKFFDYVDSLKGDEYSDTALLYPDGSPLTVNDAHWQSVSSNLADNTIKVNDFNKNIELNHFGLYGLRYGNSEEAQQINLSVQASTGVSHQHSSYLAMSYYSGGMELFPDSGYVTSAMGNYRYFSTATYHHNTATAFESTGNSSTDIGSFYARPNIYAYDDGAASKKQIQLVEGSNLMPDCNTDEFSNNYGVDINRRMLLNIATDENHSYAVDIHRIKGSNVRESYLISSEEEDTEITHSLTDAENYTGSLTNYLKSKGKSGGSLLNANSSYSGKIVNPIVSNTSNAFNFTWKGKTASVNAYIKGNSNSTIAFSQMPSVRRIDNNLSTASKKTYETSSRHLYRRVDVPEESDEVTTFAGVYEGVKNNETSKISYVYWANTGDDMTTALIVNHTSGIRDYIYVSADNVERPVGTYKMSGSVCIVRTDSSGNIVYSYIYGDGKISKGADIIHQGKSDVSYNVVSASGARSTVSDFSNELVLDGTLPEAAKGIWGSVNFADGSGTAFRIEETNENKILINNDPGFYMSGSNAVFTSYPMYEDTSKPGRIAEWSSPILKSGTITQRTRGDVKFTLKTPTFIKY